MTTSNMMFRLCPVCNSFRPQTELICKNVTDNGGSCNNTHLAQEPLGWPGTVIELTAPTPVAVLERWYCTQGHEASPGDLLCDRCGEDVRRYEDDEYPPASAPEPQTGFGERSQDPFDSGEAQQLPPGPLAQEETRIGRWLIAGVTLKADSAIASHICVSDQGEVGELQLLATTSNFEALTAVCPDRFRSVLDLGEWHGRKYTVVESLPPQSWAKRFDATGQSLAVRAFLDQLGSALDRLHKAGFCLRTLGPHNIIARESEELDLALTGLSDAIRADELIDPVPLTSLNAFYAAPEVLAGGYAVQSDWWSLGAILLDRITKGEIFKGINQSVWRVHAVTADVPLPDTLDPALDLLLGGLLARDLTQRWQWPEIKAWLNGETIQAPGRSVIGADTGSPIALGGVLHRNLMRYAIAAASEQHWDEARLQFERGELLAWCLQNNAPEETIANLRKVSASTIDPEFKFGMALKCLYPDLPFVRRGVIVNAAWLLHNLDEGYDLINGPVTMLLERLGFEPELVRLKKRAASARARAKANQIVLDEASFRTRLLATNIRKLAAEWETRRADSPESDHRGLARMMRRANYTDEDLILLSSAALTQFKSRSTILEEARALALEFKLAFNKSEADALICARSGRDILADTEAHIADFSRCGVGKIDEWADSLRQTRQLSLSRSLLVLAVSADHWKKPEGREYTAKILSFFEDKIALSIKRGSLTRLTVTKTSDRIDVTELGTEIKGAGPLLGMVLERGAGVAQIHPAAFQSKPGLEGRMRRLVQRATQYKRDTGIDCLYLGFPFILHQPEAGDVKPRIAPLFLWPVKFTSGVEKFGPDLSRKVVLNPAIDGFLTALQVADCHVAFEEIEKGGTITSILDECASIAKIERKTLAQLPPADVKVKATRLVPAAVLFNAVYPGQSLISDLQSLQQRPVVGTALATLLRLGGVETAPVTAKPREAEKFFVAAIDPSQEEAVMRARHGAGLLIEGPPGTGKSQTIVNLIADAIGRGKSLLFVCQKQAALDVVFNRLKAEDLQDRVILIKDESKDRRATVQALRDQATALQASGAKSQRSGSRRRTDLANNIDDLEGGIDAHHEALYRVHASYDRSFADILTELIMIEDENGELPLLRVRGLKSVIAPWTPQTVGTVAEACASVARDWLPARYEESQLAALKIFAPDAGTLGEFHEDFAAFCDAEAQRNEVLQNNPCPFDVDDPKAVRYWLATHSRALESLEVELCADLKRWTARFHARRGQPVEARALWDELGAIREMARNLEDARIASRTDSRLWSALSAENASDLDGWVAVANQFAAPASGFTRLSIARYLARRKLSRYVVQACGVETAIGVAAFRQAATHAVQLRALQARFCQICRALEVNADHDNATATEIEAKAVDLGERLQAASALVTRLASCPKTDIAAQVCTSGNPQAYTHFSQDLAYAANRADARVASLAALEALRPWVIDAWRLESHRSIVAGELTEDRTRAIAASLDTLEAYQRFRFKLQNFPPEGWPVFEKLRASEKALQDVPSEQLEGVVRRLINHEARLGWKAAIEGKHPVLLTDRENLRSKVSQLGTKLDDIRKENRKTLQEGIDLRRVLFDQRWQQLTLLLGPNALGLRDIVERGIDLGLMALRPVWLMNPDVASRALPLKAGLFDIVVFDEASQIPVENALPALFRGKQVIVSGDEKQLPPSTFFSSAAADDDEDADDEATLDSDATEEERAAAEEAWTSSEIKDCPDLLHLARSALPESSRVMLKVHYRSEWKELIAYSNAAFYGGNLSVPVLRPDAFVSQEKPLEVLHINGTYAKQTNRAEASAIADAVANIWETAREGGETPPTIGVVTFNLKQADLIEDVLYERGRKNTAFAADYGIQMNRIEGGADVGFFVKNLENVQGDERDIILFSTTFGKDDQGKFRRNFGVLGQQGGERRLNVAITRARQKMIIATSMPINAISDCLDSNRKPQTPRDFLQLYMQYANFVSDGQLSAARALLSGMGQATQTRADTDMTDFASIVSDFLGRRGIRTVKNHDGSAFAVDLAVENNSGNYCIGIECEAPQHPLLTAARARELWRPQSLRKAIPRLHRVSLQGWNEHRTLEQDHLIKAVHHAMESEHERA